MNNNQNNFFDDKFENLSDVEKYKVVREELNSIFKNIGRKNVVVKYKGRNIVVSEDKKEICEMLIQLKDELVNRINTANKSSDEITNNANVAISEEKSHDDEEVVEVRKDLEEIKEKDSANGLDEDVEVSSEDESKDVEVSSEDESKDVEVSLEDESKDVEVSLEDESKDVEVSSEDESKDVEVSSEDESKEVEVSSEDESKDVEVSSEDEDNTFEESKNPIMSFVGGIISSIGTGYSKIKNKFISKENNPISNDGNNDINSENEENSEKEVTVKTTSDLVENVETTTEDESKEIDNNKKSIGKRFFGFALFTGIISAIVTRFNKIKRKFTYKKDANVVVNDEGNSLSQNENASTELTNEINSDAKEEVKVAKNNLDENADKDCSDDLSDNIEATNDDELKEADQNKIDKKKTKKKKKKGSFKKRIGAFLCAIAIALGFVSCNILNKRNNNFNNDTKKESSSQTDIDSDLIDDDIKNDNDIKNDDDIKTDDDIKNDEETIDKSNVVLSVDDTVTINNNSYIYTNSYDATYETNACNPYFENKHDRDVQGLVYELNGNIYVVYENDYNAIEKQKYFEEQGAVMTAVLVSRSDMLVDGEYEGYYNINSVKVKTKSL